MSDGCLIKSRFGVLKRSVLCFLKIEFKHNHNRLQCECDRDEELMNLQLHLNKYNNINHNL